jgi:hypothetical protein
LVSKSNQFSLKYLKTAYNLEERERGGERERDSKEKVI